MKEWLKEIIRVPAESALAVWLRSQPQEKFSPEKISRILVFAYMGLGNFILYTPALKLLRQRYPRARIDLQTGNNTGCEQVLAGADIFDNVYDLPYSAGMKAWLRRAAGIRSTGYDLTINEFHSHSWQLALMLAASGARFRAGHVTSPGWPRRLSRYSFVFNLPVEMREDQHEIDRYIELVSTAGAERIALEDARTFMHLEDEDRRFAERFLEESIKRPRRIIIGIQPGTSPSMRWKQWPVDRFRELIERPGREVDDSLIVLFGSPNESMMVEELARGMGSNVVVAAGKTTVKQVAALIERCDLLVSNDSGLMHTAVAVGTPVVAIYGPTDIRRTAPLGPLNTVIRRELECSPCFKLEGEEQIHRCPHHDCLMTISSDEVFQIVSRRASELRPAASKESIA